MAHLNRHLNYVVPLYGDDEEHPEKYVHCTLVTREVFEAHWFLLARVWGRIMAGGLGVGSGPRIAYLMLKEEAKASELEPQLHDLMTEIRRLMNVIVATGKGWETVPFEEATKRKLIDEDDAREVMNAVAFFTVISHMAQRQRVKLLLERTADLWGARIVHLNSMDFRGSLETLTAAENTGEKLPVDWQLPT